MKTYAIQTLFLGVILLFSSCLKDLDTVPLTDEKLLPEKAWENISSYEQFLAKIYAGLALSGNEGPFGLPDISAGDQGEATFVRSYWNLQELCTDEVIGSEDNETMRGLQFCQWNSNNKFVALNYTRIYMNIAYANEYIRETEDAKLEQRNVTEAQKQQIRQYRSEAFALRALNYYFLMDLYGNVPFIDENSPVGTVAVKQENRQFLFSWIESQLKAVEDNLPAPVMDNYGKIQAPAVWMILAKMYLNAEVYIGEPRYDDCLVYLNKILDSDYTIELNYKHLFGADNHLSKEIIFPIVYDGRQATTFGGTTFLIAAANRSDMNPSTTVGFSSAWSNIRAKETLSNSFEEGDIRALFWKQDRTLETDIWYDFTKGWSVIKYSNLNRDNSSGSNPNHADTDFPLFRLADAYLMYAEAVLRGGQGGSRSQALLYINALRLRADAGDIADVELTLDFILEERMRELYWEGHRRTDLIRYNRFTKNYRWPWKNGVHSGVASIDDKYKIYPLPVTEVTSNLMLKQNPGY